MAQRYQVPAVKRAFEIIELLATRDAGAGISEIRRALQLPLSSVAAIVYTLTDLGFFERDERTSRYRLSVKLFGIARRALDRMDLVGRCELSAAGVRCTRSAPLTLKNAMPLQNQLVRFSN